METGIIIWKSAVTPEGSEGQNMSDIVLRKLTSADEAAFMEGAKLWDGESLTWYTSKWKPGMGYAEMLEALEREACGEGLAEGRVPATMLYGFLGEIVIGRLHIRHRLNEHLLRRGGHIGYAVAPIFRGRKFATQMLKQGLEYCRSLGIDKVLITCADKNEPSWKTIENSGGVLENKIFDDEDQEIIRRYWIAL